MTEWWTYSLSDFLLFSPRTYWRLFELQNEAVWPLQVLALLTGAGMLVQVVHPQPRSDRVISILLGAIWVWIAWSFFWVRYATINWAAVYAVPAFVAEALLFVWIGGVRGQLHYRASRSTPGILGSGLVAYAVVLHPFTAVLSGRPLAAAEVFGIAPDPTAIASLGFLSMASGGVLVWLLLIVPLGWCIVSWATMVAMGAWESWMPLTAAGLAIAARIWIYLHRTSR